MTEPSSNDVVLREVADEDLPIFYEHQRDADATRMAGFRARDRDAFMTHWAKIRGDETVTLRTIVAGGRVAGNIVHFEHHGRALVGYWIGKEHWGRGIATRALAAFLRVVPARPLYARVARHNVGSIRVLEKCGFVRQQDESPESSVEECDELLFGLGQ